MRSGFRQAFARGDYLCGFFVYLKLGNKDEYGSRVAWGGTREALLRGIVASPLAKLCTGGVI